MAATKIIIASTGATYDLPGTSWTAEQVVAQFSSTLPELASMSSEVTTDANGDKTITFRPRTGTKG